MLIICSYLLANIYIRQRSWANVMYSSPFVCLSVCYFAKARRAFSQSILVSTVCYFAKVNDFSQSILVSTVCLSVCKSVCLSVCHASYRPQFCTDQDYFFTVDSAYPANFTFFFCKYRPKVKVKVTKNHENNYLSHNFWIRCRRDFWLVAKCSL